MADVSVYATELVKVVERMVRQICQPEKAVVDAVNYAKRGTSAREPFHKAVRKLAPFTQCLKHPLRTAFYGVAVVEEKREVK